MNMNELTEQEEWQIDSYADDISSLGGLIDEINDDKYSAELLTEAIDSLLPNDVDELLVIIKKLGWTGKVNDYCDYLREEMIRNFALKL